MKTGGLNLWLAAAVVAVFFAAVLNDRAQQPPIGHAKNFTSNMYFEPPYERQVKMRLSGAEASPLPGGLLDVKDLKIEVFNTNGMEQLVAKAPQCTYSPMQGTASSEGHLKLSSGDGKFRIEGDGFLFVWRQSASSLTLSNHVRAVIMTGLLQQ